MAAAARLALAAVKRQIKSNKDKELQSYYNSVTPLHKSTYSM
jgi:hypothetical protein